MFVHSRTHLLHLTHVVKLSLYQAGCRAWGCRDTVIALKAHSLVGVLRGKTDIETDVINKYLMCVVYRGGAHPGFDRFGRKCPIQPGVRWGSGKASGEKGHGLGESSNRYVLEWGGIQGAGFKVGGGPHEERQKAVTG